MPHAVWVPYAERIAGVVRASSRPSVAVIASNRMTDLRDVEDVLARGAVDAVALARPFLADPAIVAKSTAGHFDRVTTCIGCNQACIDRSIFGKPVSCLVNPRAARELEFPVMPSRRILRVAVVGAGPAGLSAAVDLARRGNSVTVFEATVVARRPVRPRRVDPRQRRLCGPRPRDARRAGADGCDRRHRPRGRGAGSRGIRSRDRRHRRPAAHSRHPRHRSASRRHLRAGAPRRCAGGHRRPHRRRRHRRRHGRVPRRVGPRGRTRRGVRHGERPAGRRRLRGLVAATARRDPPTPRSGPAPRSP